MKPIIIILILVLLILGCQAVPKPQTQETSLPPEPGETSIMPPVETSVSETVEPPTPVETPAETMSEPDPSAELSLREKVGQLFIIRPDALDRSISFTELEDPISIGVTQLSETMKQFLTDYPVGGFVFFQKNLIDPEQLQQFQDELNTTAKLPLFFAIDEEGGLVTRLAKVPAFNVPTFPMMAEIGQSGDNTKAYEVGLTIGNYLKQHGFNLDFAPVADVNSNPDNPIIGPRAFSSDPLVAGSMVKAAVQGFHEAGVMTSLKHFPGHGDTQTDSHLGIASTSKTWEEMKQVEMISFERGIEAGSDFVMLGHIQTPNVTGNDLPVSLSPDIIKRLRDELGFTGLITTDSLAMGAITKEYTSEEAVLMAFEAGVDILLMPEDIEAAFQAIEQAVTSGRISESDLDARVIQILELKQAYNLK